MEKDTKKKADPKEIDEKGVGFDESDDESSVKNKLTSFLIVLFIILIWLGIFAVFIKYDVGKFGSTVLSPILSDVPVINQILPNDGVNSEDSAMGEEYPFDNLEDAMTQIKALEQQLADAQAEASTDNENVTQLQAEIDRLKVFEDQQNEYQQLKSKFDSEVVYTDNAPDISEYKKYYESIDPTNAEELYKQVVEQTQYSDKVKSYAEAYSKMKPAQAAGIFEQMTTNLQLVAEILNNMSTQARGDILGAMDPTVAAKVTSLMAPK